MKNLILLLFVCLFNATYAQDSILVRDFESWNGISLKKSFLEKKLDLQLSQEFRFNNNSSRLNNYFTEIGADYEIIKGLEAGLGTDLYAIIPKTDM